MSASILKQMLDFTRGVRRSSALAAVAAGGAAYGIWYGSAANSGTWDSPVALALLTLLLGFDAVTHASDWPRPNTATRAAAFLLLLATACLAVRGLSADNSWTRGAVLSLTAAAIILWTAGLRGVIGFLPFLTMALWVMPFQETITLSASYPLRLLSTVISAGLLQTFGMNISHHLTSIFIGDANIAITDACSGIDQLGVLLLLAAWLIRRLRLGIGWKLVYIAMLLPIVVAANSIRLIITILLYKMLGDSAFDLTIHVLLGYFFVILSVVMLYYAGKLLPEPEK